jgi:hypothetical protein
MSQEENPDSSHEPRNGGGAPARRPGWIVGGVLIVLGVYFIIQHVAGFSLHNWWALFILIPATGGADPDPPLVREGEHHSERYDPRVECDLVGGLGPRLCRG